MRAQIASWVVALYAALTFCAVAHAQISNTQQQGENQQQGSQGRAQERGVLHIAMTAAFVSENGTDIYKDIADYLSKRTGMNTDMVSGLSYDTVDQMLRDGAVQMAFVCGYGLQQEGI